MYCALNRPRLDTLKAAPMQKHSPANALPGREVFSASPLHGKTQFQQRSQWDSVNSDHVVLIDTPGIDELEGEAR